MEDTLRSQDTNIAPNRELFSPWTSAASQLLALEASMELRAPAELRSHHGGLDSPRIEMR